MPAVRVVELNAQLDMTTARVQALEAQLAAEQAGRRADVERLDEKHRAEQERLLRELMAARVEIARLEERLKGQSPPA
jgi:hypothetical protein